MWPASNDSPCGTVTASVELWSGDTDPNDCVVFVLKLLANMVIYVCAITVGIMSYYMADRKHRKAFLEARQSLEVKLNLEEQSQQQVSGAGAAASRTVGGALVAPAGSASAVHVQLVQTHHQHGRTSCG